MPYGVSEQMIDTYSELIFDLSLNKQTRSGDPIRNLDHEAWLEQREATGLNDPEIAGKIGLAVEQVTFIRNITERRLFRLNQYRKLYRLGGGLRYREDRYQDPEEKFDMSDDAVALRVAMHFSPSQAKKFIDAGLWSDEVLGDLMAVKNPDDLAIISTAESVTYKQLGQRAKQMAAGLAEIGVRRGDVVAALLPMGPELFVSYFACAQMGTVFLPLVPSLSCFEIGEYVRHCHSRIVVCENTAGEVPIGAVAYHDLVAAQVSDRPGFVQVAADPILLTTSMRKNEQPDAGILTHQNMMSAVHTVMPLLKLAPQDQIDLSALPVSSVSLMLAQCAFTAGVSAVTDPASATHTVTPTKDGWYEISVADHKAHFWGQSDTLAVLSAKQNNSAAIALPGVETRVVDPDGAILGDGETGELQIRGPSLIAGYLAYSTSSAEIWTADGWYKTGTEVTVSDQSGGTVGYSIKGVNQ
ncbi:MAG: class I adenylate-forming enzyme family protein [Rhodospirillales bacterium]|nr:class I adenylate-forming enzyme family protein [Rhodospirillales bacterium]